ncbi:MAG: AAA family ATPase [Alphaproteobacteria bacterium]|nr:AAA family ATPase [Alphaproteobacteria bacterium]
MAKNKSTWHLFTGASDPPAEGPRALPEPPPWRRLGANQHKKKRLRRQWNQRELDVVNAALHLRRPILVQGEAGSGKSMMAYDLAYELGLGHVLEWPINSRTEVRRALYDYDAVGRLQEATILAHTPRQQNAPPPRPPPVHQYIQLGPLGTALAYEAHPRVLLIDELDKCDIDLPNDLLFYLEQARFTIPEISRAHEIEARAGQNNPDKVHVRPHDFDPAHPEQTPQIEVIKGQVLCRHFPIVVMTSNFQRDFPPPFLRRCLRLKLEPPTNRDEALREATNIANSQLPGGDAVEAASTYVQALVDRRAAGEVLANDQLLNALYLTGRTWDDKEDARRIETLALDTLLRNLRKS